MMLAFDENRKYYRLSLNSPCKITLEGEIIYGICKDISVTGMSFQTSASSLIEGTVLLIETKSQDPKIPSILADAEVIRVNSMDDENYLIGVKFLQLN